MGVYTFAAHTAGGAVTYHDGVEDVRLRLPAERAAFVAPPHVPPCTLPAEVEDALRGPVGSPRLAELAAGAERVAVITSDSTRAVPCTDLLTPLLAELGHAGVTPEQVTVVVALGVHREATPAELRDFLGEWAGRVAIENHRPHDAAHLVRCGTTARGNAVLVNRTVAEADLRIAFGQVEPHEFAGFSGGPKSILAGVSGERSIRFNHSPAMLLDPASRPGVRDGNPIWEDMSEAAELAGLDFIVNVVLTPALEVAAVTAGALRPAHEAAVRRYRTLYATDLPDAQADIVVTTPGRPLNRNLYQTAKAVIAAEATVRDGGVVVFYASCAEGVGGEHFPTPYRGAQSPAEVIARLKDDYRIEMDHALLLCRLMAERDLRLLCVVPGVEAATLRDMFLEPHASLQEAYESACGIVGGAGGAPQTLVFPQPQKSVFGP